MIAIRADANKQIAMGHVMRCLSIAKQLRVIGESVVFFTSGEYARNLIEDNGFECCCLKYEYDDKEAEISELIELLKIRKVDVLLIDSYQVTENYMRKLKDEFKIVYIDDVNKFRYPADLIINYTYNVDKSLYEKWNYDSKTIFLLGSRYIPLRPEFTNMDIICSDKVKNIFITTGGADEYDMLLEVVNRLLSPEWCQFNKFVVAGKFCEHISDLRGIEQKENSVKLYHNVSDIADIMKQCDVAISAGGTTIAELCACGIPTIAFSVAENQIRGLEAYANDGVIRYAGDVRKEKNGVICNVEMYLKEFVKNNKIRVQKGRRANSIIDGNGAMRIAQKIRSIYE